MPISQVRQADWRCHHCGEVTSRPTWLAVDAIERPDLVAQVSDLVEFECPKCFGPVGRSQPLLVLRMATVSPLIAARATDDERDPLETLAETVDAVQRELGDKLDEVPGPPAVVTFSEVEAGAGADIDGDVKALQAGADREISKDPAYRRLIDEVSLTQKRQRIDAGLKALALVGSEAQLRDVLELWPEVMSDEAEFRATEHVERAGTEENRRFGVSMLRTVQLCRQGDVSGAWSVRESVIRRFWDETVTPRLGQFRESERDGAPPSLAQAGMDLLNVLPPGTHPALQAEVAAKTVAALLADEGPKRDENIERAIQLGRMVVSILDTYPDVDHPQSRVSILMNLSMAFGTRPAGDPAWNRAQSLALLKDAIDLAWEAGDVDSWAMAQTNLALLLLNRGEAGDVDQAREHLELALSHRSRERDPGDWAFTQLHLGMAYARTGSGDRRATLRRAIHHSGNARDGAISAGHATLLAYAERNLAAQQYRLSQMAGTPPAGQSNLLDRAEASATESVRLSPIDISPLRFGHAWSIIGKIRSARADQDGAIEAFKTALTALSANVGPTEAREASRHLIALAEDRDDVELAADAAERLTAASAAAISTHSRAEDRMSEHSESSTDFRFAAHAMVRAGRLEGAITTLELGRTRELGLLTLTEDIDLEALSQLDPSLRAEVEELASDFRADILGTNKGSESDRSERLARIRAALQRTPTFEEAFSPPTLGEVGRVVQPQRPLVYLGSAPKGSFAIIVGKDHDGRIELEAVHAPDCTSQAIAYLAIGLGTDGSVVPSYLAAQLHRPDLLDAAIESLSPLVGEKLLKPLVDSLIRRGVSGITLVPTGLLGLMPLHAITWSGTASNPRSLLDSFDVRFAPSARLQLACIQRASMRDGDPIRFVGIANPLPHSDPLEGAELEIELVRRFVPTGDLSILRGEAATKERVLEALPSATHVHFACHGGGRLFDPLFSAGLSLAGETDLSALEVAGLRIPARLVVASACETGVTQGYEEIDESLGLASAFLAGGAAGVVSTLWSVVDFPTAIIISKFYEALFQAHKPPAAALREAQLWVRDADRSAIDAYASARAPLRALRSRHHSSADPSTAAPYRAPSFWAAFVFTGA